MKYFTLAVILCSSFFSVKAQTTDSLNMTLQYHWDDTTFWQSGNSEKDQQFNEVWGWYNPADGREYAIMGSAEYTLFFDVTDLNSSHLVQAYPGADIADQHRDYKTYGNYLYAVADEGSNSTLQIFDLSYLPDSVKLVYDDDEYIRRAHNIFIDGHFLYACSVDAEYLPGLGGNRGVRILDISNPEQPSFYYDKRLPDWSPFVGPEGTHVHDVYVKDDIMFSSNGNAGLFIYDISDTNEFEIISSVTAYSEQGYNHNSWLNEDCSTLFFTDENKGLGIKSYDVSNLSEVQMNALFKVDNSATAHNVVAHGNLLFVSYYRHGVRVYDISDPSIEPLEVAYYDTYYLTGSSSEYSGAWGVYPFLPSGKILVSDMQTGLYVFTLDNIVNNVSPTECHLYSNVDEALEDRTIQVSPNPFTDHFTIHLADNQEVDHLSLVNSLGEVCDVSYTRSQSQLVLDGSSLPVGMYLLHLPPYGNARIVKR